MRRVLILDDEAPARRRLRQLLQKVPGIKVVAEAATVEAAAAHYRELRPDLLLLDVQLARGDCFELFDEVQIEADVILVTAYERYAVRAFEVNALDYLIKPVAQDRLAMALRRRRTEAQPEAFEPDDTVAVRSTRGWRFIPLAAVDRILACDDYTELHLADGEPALSDLTMIEWESRLPETFLRIHRKHIVRWSQITGLHRQTNTWQVRLSSNIELPVGRSRLAQVRRVLGVGSSA